ncbi:MAG TPA: hypothetical protein VLH19_01695 [Patescibacteria group bacterium]|nr:hypothetical protein [Patescibacteria group bacterium]
MESEKSPTELESPANISSVINRFYDSLDVLFKETDPDLPEVQIEHPTRVLRRSLVEQDATIMSAKKTAEGIDSLKMAQAFRGFNDRVHDEAERVGKLAKSPMMSNPITATFDSVAMRTAARQLIDRVTAKMKISQNTEISESDMGNARSLTVRFYFGGELPRAGVHPSRG